MALSLTLQLSVAIAAADEEKRLFAVKGLGALDCAAYLQAVEEGSAKLAPYAGYISGYVSAYNEQAPQTYDLLPWQTIDTVMIVVARRCQQIPSLRFGVALSQVATYFRRQRLRELPERVSFGTGEDAVELYSPIADQLTEALLQRGYLDKRDGDVTSALRAAQTDLGLDVTGIPDQFTLLRLFYTKPEIAAE